MIYRETKSTPWVELGTNSESIYTLSGQLKVAYRNAGAMLHHT